MPGPDEQADGALGGDVEHDAVGLGTQHVGDDAVGAGRRVLHHAVVTGDDHAPIMTRGCHTPSVCATLGSAAEARRRASTIT